MASVRAQMRRLPHLRLALCGAVWPGHNRWDTMRPTRSPGRQGVQHCHGRHPQDEVSDRVTVGDTGPAGESVVLPAPETGLSRPLRRVANPWVRSRRLGLLVLAVVAMVLSWLRMGSTARDTVWAEDGGVFLAGSAQPGWSPLEWFAPYQGY